MAASVVRAVAGMAEPGRFRRGRVYATQGAVVRLVLDPGIVRADSLRFKVPTLRNLVFTYPYMHDGRFRKLGQALRHYVSGIPEGVSPDERLRGRLSLDDRDLTDLTAFLMTLNDTAFVFHPAHGFPR